MKVKNFLLCGIGFLMLTIGAIGLFLPIWPTIPFILVASGCFASTPVLHTQIMKIPFVNEYIRNYKDRKGISGKTIAVSLIFLWVMLIASVLHIGKLWIMCLLALVGIAVTIHIIWIARPREGGTMIKISSSPKKSTNIFRYFEVAFDVPYLIVAVCIGIGILRHHTGTTGLLSGVMALVLAGGDAFHLIPRIIVTISGSHDRLKGMLGFGKLITSITMTLFYVLLWHLGLLLFAPTFGWGWTALVYALADLRMVLCLFKQNGWTCANPSLRWSMLRNIPFLLLGIIVALLFGTYRNVIEPLKHMWLAIALSFAFYIPVVIGVHKNPKLGMLMFPKTCMYIWMLAMCSML